MSFLGRDLSLGPVSLGVWPVTHADMDEVPELRREGSGPVHRAGWESFQRAGRAFLASGLCPAPPSA